MTPSAVWLETRVRRLYEKGNGHPCGAVRLGLDLLSNRAVESEGGCGDVLLWKNRLCKRKSDGPPAEYEGMANGADGLRGLCGDDGSGGMPRRSKSARCCAASCR